MSNGYLYVLINPKMPGIAKVGKTTREPSERVAELSGATGVPSPFILAYQQPVADCDAAEVWVHAELERGGFRVSANREFFDAPLHQVVAILAQAGGVVSTDLDNPTPERVSPASQKLIDDLLRLAEKFRSGADVLVNEKKALGYYEQAAGLGSPEGCVGAGIILHFGGNNVRPDPEKAIGYYKRATALGWWHCYQFMADVFKQQKHKVGVANCWRQLFEAANSCVHGEESGVTLARVGSAGADYFYDIAGGEIEHTVPNDLIAPFKDAIAHGLRDKAAAEQELPWSLRGNLSVASQLLSNATT